MREQGGKGQMLCDAEPSRYTTLPEFPGHLFVGEMSDQLVRVEDETGYGFVDTEKLDRLSRRSSSGPPTSAKDAPKSRPHRAWA